MRTSAGMSSAFVSPTSGWSSRPSTHLERALLDVFVGAVDRVARLEADDRLPAALRERGARCGGRQDVGRELGAGCSGSAGTRTGPARQRRPRRAARPRRGAPCRSCGRPGAPRARGRARRPPRRSGRPAAPAIAAFSASSSPVGCLGVGRERHRDAPGQPVGEVHLVDHARASRSEPWKPRSGLKPPTASSSRSAAWRAGSASTAGEPVRRRFARLLALLAARPAGRPARLHVRSDQRTTKASSARLGYLASAGCRPALRPSPGRPSGPRAGPRPASPDGCSACSRSTGSSGREAGCRGRRARGCGPSTSSRVQSASGFAFTRPNFSSHSTFACWRASGPGRGARPVIQASTWPSARFSGSTLRIAQHWFGSRAHSSSPCRRACSSSVMLW